MEGAHLRRLAATVEDAAVRVRAVAVRAARSPALMEWRSLSADLYRARIEDESHRLQQSAAALDRAVEALRRHASAMDGR